MSTNHSDELVAKVRACLQKERDGLIGKLRVVNEAFASPKSFEIRKSGGVESAVFGNGLEIAIGFVSPIQVEPVSGEEPESGDPDVLTEKLTAMKNPESESTDDN